MNWKAYTKRNIALTLSALMLVSVTGCGNREPVEEARVGQVEEQLTTTDIQFFSSSTIVPDDIDWQQSASGQCFTYAKTLIPDLNFNFQNFAADGATMTYDEACVERIQSGAGDDIILANSDVIMNMGRAGLLADLSDIDGADELLPAVRASLTIDGKLVAFPWEYVAYGLIVNNDILKEHGLEMPNTPEEFLACCEKLKADGMETPMAANRWWLECFVLTQGFAEFYQSDNMEQLIADLNDGTTKMSEYMRPGFEFLKTCIDNGYINAQQALEYEAFMERDAFLGGESAFMLSFTGAVTGEGRKLNNYDFDLHVTGLPTDNGQVALVNATGMVVPADDKHMEETKRAIAALGSAESVRIYCEKGGNFPSRSDVTTSMLEKPAVADFVDDINADRTVPANNPSINMELWGNVCEVVRDLLGGASVDECMATIDRLQAEANAAVNP